MTSHLLLKEEMQASTFLYVYVMSRSAALTCSDRQ